MKCPKLVMGGEHCEAVLGLFGQGGVLEKCAHALKRERISCRVSRDEGVMILFFVMKG